MKKILRMLLVIPQILIGGFAFCQTDTSHHDVKITQMTVMVIPRANDNEDIRTILDQSDIKRTAVAQVKEAFDNRGFRTIDFTARLNAIKTNSAFMSADPKNARSMIIQNSGTDLVVEVDATANPYSGSANVATVNLQCIDPSSAFVIGIHKCDSPPNSAAIAALVQRALNDDCLNNFLNSMDGGLKDMVENGRHLKIEVAPSASSTKNLFSDVGNSGDNVTDKIRNWLKDHTVNGNFVDNGSTELLLDFDDVRIQFLDDHGRNYKPYDFGHDMIAYLRSINITARSEIRNGTIYITIN